MKALVFFTDSEGVNCFTVVGGDVAESARRRCKHGQGDELISKSRL